jgi:hypothetical protein
MCCFTGPVHVEGTRIFARALDGVRQAIVYSMKVTAKAPVAMVLPLPALGDLTFVNLEGYASFFEDLERGFPAPAVSRAFGAPQALTVQRVGSFVASFVPTPSDFARLDPQFRMPPGVFDKLPQYRDYGFAVFQLHDVNARIHPMAFSFARRNPTELFFPTVHVHDGKVHSKAPFDHALYLQLSEPFFPPELALPSGDPVEKRGWAASYLPAGKFINLSRAEGLIDGAAPVRVRRLSGKLPNEDVIFPLPSQPPQPQA